jgi:hypothetical protein
VIVALRAIMVALLVLVSPGMLLHYAWDGCHDFHNCPICQHLQGSPAEGAPDATTFDGGDCVCAPVIACVAAAHSREEVSSATPRAPPVL